MDTKHIRIVKALTVEQYTLFLNFEVGTIKTKDNWFGILKQTNSLKQWNI